jgi:hypothetical protein
MRKIVLFVAAAAMPLLVAALAHAECKPSEQCTDGNCRQMLVCTNSKEVSLPSGDAAGGAAALQQQQQMVPPNAVAAAPPVAQPMTSTALPRNFSSFPGGRSRR